LKKIRIFILPIIIRQYYLESNGVYYLFKYVFLGLTLLLQCSSLTAQTASISGFVFDASNGESLIGANLYFEDYVNGAVTNHSGYYVISDLPSDDYILICTYVGFQDYKKEISLNKGESFKLSIMLEPALLETETVQVFADSERTAVQLFRKGVSQIDLTPMEITYLPAVVETDLMRSLQSLPGILPISDYSSEIYVRGGTSDQNLFLVDGADVYNPEHAFGLFSTFNTDAIKDIEISKGGFSADYGGRLSSVIDVTNLDGNRNHFEGTAEISLLSAKATVQLPMWNFGSLSASYRRTYIGETAKLFVDDIPDYYFYDGHVKAFFDIDADNKLTFSVYNGRDDLNYNFNSEDDDAPTLHYDWGNTTGSLRWTHIFNPYFFSNFWITASHFSSMFEVTDANVQERNDLSDISFKGQFEYYISKSFSTKFGFEFKDLDTILEQDSPGGIVDIERNRQFYMGYASLLWNPSVHWNLEAGLRYNIFDADYVFNDLAPRFAAKYRLTETINLKAAFGTFYQYLHKIQRPFIADIWTTSDQYYDRSKSLHYIIGFQKELAHNISLEIEGYYKEYQNLYTLKHYFLDFVPSGYDSRGRPIYTETNGLFDRGNGNSLGLEFLLRKRFGSFNGWIAYSFAQTDYVFENINQEKGFPPRHDRTHVINAIINVDIKNALREWRGEPIQSDEKRWLFGMNFVYTSGQPITLTSSTYSTNSIPDQDYNQLFLYPAATNSFRLPYYSRLDLSLTYKIMYEGWSMAPFLQIYNIGNRENVWFIEYESEEKENVINQTVETTDMFPILPTLGVKFEF